MKQLSHFPILFPKWPHCTESMQKVFSLKMFLFLWFGAVLSHAAAVAEPFSGVCGPVMMWLNARCWKGLFGDDQLWPLQINCPWTLKRISSANSGLKPKSMPCRTVPLVFVSQHPLQSQKWANQALIFSFSKLVLPSSGGDFSVEFSCSLPLLGLLLLPAACLEQNLLQYQ